MEAQHPEELTDLEYVFVHQQERPACELQKEHETEVLQDCALARHDKDPMISATAKTFILRMKGNQDPTNVALPLLAFYAA